MASASYPRTVNQGGRLIELRMLDCDSADAILAFARSLPQEDLQFLRIDITDRKVVDRWVQSVADGLRVTIIARHEGKVVGYGSLNRRELSWMRHLGEIRVIVAPDFRRSGLGGVLAHEIFAQTTALGLTRIVAQMGREQQGARRLFQDLGFSVEAVLADWIIDRDEATRDLVIMSYDVSGLGS